MAKLAHVPILNSDLTHAKMLETPKVPSLQRADLKGDARSVKHQLLLRQLRLQVAAECNATKAGANFLQIKGANYE